MRGNSTFSKNRISFGKLFCLLSFLVFLELSVVTGRISGILDARNSLEAGRMAHFITGIRTGVDDLDMASLSAGRQTEPICQENVGRQRVFTRELSRSHAMACGLVFICFYPVFGRLCTHFKKGKTDGHLEHIVSHLYYLSYL